MFGYPDETNVFDKLQGHAFLTMSHLLVEITLSLSVNFITFLLLDKGSSNL